jgi:tetratricopeptide (TPR) repeat protein
MSYIEALEALKKGEYKEAIEWFDGLLPAERDGKSYALAALAHFKREEYEDAEKLYAEAVTAGGTDATDWPKMQALANANHVAKINIEVPKPHYFADDDLLGPPSVRNGELVCPKEPAARHGCLKRLRLFLGEALGVLGTKVIDVATRVVGWRYDYRGRLWTNWDGRRWLSGVLTLAYIRELLNAHNLVSTYPHGELVAFQAKDQKHPPSVENFRTADGSWNNLDDPKEGAAGTRFLRNVDLSTAQPEKGKRLETPNARKISLELLSRPVDDHGQPKVQEVPFLNLLAASWIQFMIHDWVSHSDTQPGAVITVDLPIGDPARDRYQQTDLAIGKTQVDPTLGGPTGGVKEPAATSFINEVTHWWDGSQIYGSDQITQDSLRTKHSGKMQLNDDGTLPVDSGTGVEEAGFLRNWWVGLSMLHTLFVHEHNAICDMLHEAYPHWDDECLFNVARLINAALIAKIHSVEWTPAILPNQTLETGLNSNWYGLLTFLLHKGKARKTVADVNIRNPELGGIVGNPINNHDCAYGLSEEFVEVYRLHSLLPETLQLRRPGEDKADPVPLPATRQHGSACMTQDCKDKKCSGFFTGTKKYAMSDLFYSFGNQHPGALVLNNFPRFMQELSVAGNTFLDMGTVDIVRARERGVPRYNEFRRQLGLNPIQSFDDLTDDPVVTKKLESIYGSGRKGVEDLDLLIGTLAETQRPKGFGFGETVFQIFILSASRRLQADRFYTDCYNEDVYTAEGLRWIDQTDLKTVILRHYPELADTGLASIKNAFEPWDDDPDLRPEQHPLRAWDCDVQADLWRGGTHRRG